MVPAGFNVHSQSVRACLSVRMRLCWRTRHSLSVTEQTEATHEPREQLAVHEIRHAEQPDPRPARRSKPRPRGRPAVAAVARASAGGAPASRRATGRASGLNRLVINHRYGAVSDCSPTAPTVVTALPWTTGSRVGSKKIFAPR